MTPEEIARLAIARTGVRMSARLAARFVTTRWETICHLFRLKLLRTNSALTLPAEYTTGTVTTTRGSTSVTGSGTAWTNDLEGRHVRFRTAWYKIDQVQSATVLVLATAYGEQAVTAGSYTIVQRFYQMPDNINHIGDPMIHQRLLREVWMRPQEELDLYEPARTRIGEPLWWSDIGMEDDARLIEVYPGGGSTIESLHYFGWKKPEPLQFQMPIPPFLDPSVLRAGVEADLLRVRGVELVEVNQAAGQTMLNEARRQESEWSSRLPRAVKDSDAIDDLQFKVMLAGSRGRGRSQERDYRSASDLVWSRDA